MRESTRVMLTSLASFGQQVMFMIIQLFLLGFVLRNLNDDVAYGIVYTIAGLNAMMYLVRDAISVGVVTRVSAARQRGDIAEISRVVNSATPFLFAVAVFATGAICMAAPQLPAVFNLREDLHPTMIWAFVLVSIDVIMVFPFFPYRSVLEGFQRYDLIAVVTIGSDLLRAGLTVASFLLWRPSVLMVIGAIVMADTLRVIVFWILSRRLVHGLGVRLGDFDGPTLRGMLHFGTFLMLASLSAVVTTEAIKWILGISKNLTFVLLGRCRNCSFNDPAGRSDDDSGTCARRQPLSGPAESGSAPANAYLRHALFSNP